MHLQMFFDSNTFERLMSKLMIALKGWAGGEGIYFNTPPIKKTLYILCFSSSSYQIVCAALIDLNITTNKINGYS